MSVKSEIKLEELKFETDSSNTNSDDDCDTYATEDLMRTFKSCSSLAEKEVDSKKYILNISSTQETHPNVAVSLSDYTCEVFNLSDNQFVKMATFAEHTDVVSEIKFSTENNNLLYTSSHDGTVKVWDLRSPLHSTLQYNDVTSCGMKNVRQLNCFDVSPDNRLIAAGTNVYDGDPYILFWDLRKITLLGGYWESHTDDVTQVKFHTRDHNSLISGSVDGLINFYDLSQEYEDDALINCLNTNSSVEKLEWLEINNSDAISYVTHTADVGFCKQDDAEPFLYFQRSDIANAMKRKSKDYVYIVNVHRGLVNPFILSGSNYKDGQFLRVLSVRNDLELVGGFLENKQRVRASWFNENTNILLTGGEKGLLNAWKISFDHSLNSASKRKKNV